MGTQLVYRNDSTNATPAAVKASGGIVKWIYAVSIDTTPVYLHLYNVASGSVTPGTTGERATFVIPSQGSTANGAGFSFSPPGGIEFSTAITIAVTTTIGGTGTPGASEVVVNIGYE